MDTPAALMALLTTEALVLRGYKLGETSKLVVLLTRDRGKVRAVARGARGARSRYQSSLEPLSEVRATLYGRQGAELLRLGQAELLHSAFRAGTRSLESALMLSGCAELVDAFCPEGEAEERTYRLAQAVVRAAGAGRVARAAGLLPRGLAAEAARPVSLARALRGLRGDRSRPAGSRTTGRRTASSARAAARPPGPSCRRRRARCSASSSVARPSPSRGPAGPQARELESFHRDRIGEHLERDLRSPRVIRETRREAVR